MNAEALAARIVVRHREAGHLRLDLPAELCGPAASAALGAGLRELAGVYRVAVDPYGRKLSVRYDEHACSAAAVARCLKALLIDLPEEATPQEAAEAPSNDATPAQGPASAVSALVKEAAFRFQDALGRLREPSAPEGTLQAKLQPVVAGALTEKAIINFLNDLVAFYLIKVHWELISQRWLKEPLKFRNAWLTTFYFVFLLVRYRKQAATK